MDVVVQVVFCELFYVLFLLKVLGMYYFCGQVDGRLRFGVGVGFGLSMWGVYCW